MPNIKIKNRQGEPIRYNGVDIVSIPSADGSSYQRYISETQVITTEPLSVTENGVYTADPNKAYTPITVNVPRGDPILQTKTVTPSTSQQTINPDIGYDGLRQVTVNAMPIGTAGTPTASKGAVSNHQVTVTPSVQNTTGYITGGTKTGTGVVVRASELVSGSETITRNGTYDVTNLAGVVVNVSGGGGSTSIVPTSDTWQHNQYVTLTLDVDAEGNLSIRQSSGGGTTTNLHICYPQGSSTTVTKIPNIPTTPGTYEFPFTTVWQGDQNNHTLTYTVISGGGEVSVIPLSVTANGTYTASSGNAYSPVTVNVSGGGGGGIPKHGVFFIDYDGSIVEAWASNEVASKTALPNNPTHTGLVAQGWNWDLQHIKSYIAAYENADVYVGQMYKTSSGLTEMDITITKVTGLTVTCNMVGNKSWGDGTTNNATSHTYTNYGNYTITCNGTSIPAGSSSAGGLFGSSTTNNNRYWCTAIRIGENVTSIGNHAIRYCYSLTNITIPQGVTSIGTYAFQSCYSLTNITIPQGVTSIGGTAFSSCYSLTSITIPQGVTSIGNNAFHSCYSLQSITIPDGVTSIGNYALYYCYSLQSITIPDDVTSIGTYVFSDCHSLVAYDFTSATSVPTLSNTNAFTNINGICKIIVPDALYNTWIAETNWATYANYIYKASEVTA